MTKTRLMLNAVAFVVAVLALPFLLVWDSFGCPAGTTEYQGVCAADLQPEKAVQTFVPSDEKPSRHPQPAWQRGDVIADTPPSQAANDAKMDAERVKADGAGKKAAGL